ncbi:hypothetical protein QYM36_016953 [Artemia franciscana]|uniref:Uncharacterized protein n=1 Tax=Artemia franciscana TaxID=6661 RepID=A0AA88H4K0_ARTSF|nr:hypothetical protein QYM36_016953 [Artemia franciscana]
MLMLQQPTIFHTGIGPNGQKSYIIPSESQSQIIQPMMPVQQPNPVFQHLGAFSISVLPTLNIQTQMATHLPASEIHPKMPAYVLQPGMLLQIQCQQSAIQATTLPQSELLFQNTKDHQLNLFLLESESIQPGYNVGTSRTPQVYYSETEKHEHPIFDNSINIGIGNVNNISIRKN